MSLTILSMMLRTAHCMYKYKALADKEEKVIFGGRLGEIAAVLEKCEQIL